METFSESKVYNFAPPVMFH